MSKVVLTKTGPGLGFLCGRTNVEMISPRFRLEFPARLDHAVPSIIRSDLVDGR